MGQKTPIYELPYETLEDVPGITLHGGLTGIEEILAEKVEENLERIDGDNVEQDQRLETVETQLYRLDHVNLNGTVGNGTDLNIPASVQGTFTSYILEVDGHVAGATASLVIHVNGDDGDNYRSNMVAIQSDLDLRHNYSANQDNAPRMGWMGEQDSFNRIIFTPRGLGEMGYMQFIGQGWANEGGANNSLVFTGGRWNGNSAALTHFRVRTNRFADEWGSGANATLWGRA